MAKYIIRLRGCDDDTKFREELTDDELELVKRICAHSKEVSTYTCMPDMSVYKDKEIAPPVWKEDATEQELLEMEYEFEDA